MIFIAVPQLTAQILEMEGQAVQTVLFIIHVTDPGIFLYDLKIMFRNLYSTTVFGAAFTA